MDVHDELRALRRETEETKWVALAAVTAIVGKEKAEEALDRIQRWMTQRRFDEGFPLYKLDLGHAYSELWRRNLLTLEEVAEHSREEIAGIRGVGRATMARLDSAMRDRDLAYAEAS
jgi:hypothetical protein